ncbi:MAG: hypothetical protein NC331_06535 [Lachnospiraceae bacterium]|nr:hypothetical protein [Lachnospiraceae bacterium]MCM1239028.1 hypothetical protein [Lachnospiraceae bacterium]
MKNDKALWGSISILAGAVIAVLALVRGAWQTWLLMGLFILWGLWVSGILLFPHIRQARQDRTRSRLGKKRFAEGIASNSPSKTAGTSSIETEALLLQHVNYRISAYLQAVYPSARWEWCEKEPEKLILTGGTGRIRIFGVPDFDHADVNLDQQANIKCDMIKIVPLSAAGNGGTDEEKAPPNKQPIDPQIWYEVQGRNILEALVGDLNSRGHSHLTLHEDGSICIEEDEGEVPKEHLPGFPEKLYWPRLVQVFERNGLAAEITAKGIQISW